MAKFGLMALVRRNDRIVKAACAGAAVYCLTIASISPSLATASAASSADSIVLSLAATRYAYAPAIKAALPVTKVRNVSNRPNYASYERERHCLATAIYFEARGESAKGQKAVAEVVLARARTPGRPQSICGVVYEGSKRRTGCQFSFTCDGVKDRVYNRDAWRTAQRIATSVMRTGGKVNAVARGATFYHADYVKPGWATRMVKVAQIGTHIFYRPKRGRLL